MLVPDGGAELQPLRERHARKDRHHRLRKAGGYRSIADHIAVTSGLPSDLDTQIFGYFDELEIRREAANRAEKAASKKKRDDANDGGDDGAGEA